MLRSAHVFSKGLLRCGRCGGPLVGRSDGRGTYECYRRKRDIAACSQRPVEREAVDSAMPAELTEKSYVSLDQTRERITAKIDSDLATARELREGAERDEHKAREALVRIGRDYRSGEITGAQWSKLEVELTAEHEAAKAKVARMIANEQALSEAVPLADVESEVLRRLLRDLFEEVIYRPAESVAEAVKYEDYRESVVAVPGAYLEPRLRSAVIERYDEEVRPVLKRLALPLGETEAAGFPTAYSLPHSGRLE